MSASLPLRFLQGVCPAPAAARRALWSHGLPGVAATLAAFLLLPAAPALAQAPLPEVHLVIETDDPTDFYEPLESYTVLEGDRDASTGLDTRFKLRYRLRSNISTSIGAKVRRERDAAAGKMGFNSNTSTLNFGGTLESSGQSQFTSSDYTAEEDGVVTLSLFADDSKYTRVMPYVTTITVLDDDTYFTVSASQTHIAEGGSVVFTITSNPDPMVVERTVGVDLVATGNVGIVGPTFREFEFGAETSSVMFTVETEDNSDVGAGAGQIRANIRSGAWKVGTPSPEAVMVLDDEIEISISPPAGGTVLEGQAAVFTLTPTSPSLSALMVNVEAPGIDQPVELPALAASVTVSVPTSGDTTPGGDSTLTATVQTGTGYSVGGTASAQVTVLDDDLTLTLSASESSLTEGDTVTFTLTANPPPVSPRTVPVSLSVNQNFKLVGSAAAGMQTLTTEATLTDGQSSHEFTVQIEDDANDSLAGELQVQIQSGPWTVSPPSPFTLPVANDDPATLTISTPRTTVVEGTPITWTLTSTPAPAVGILVGVNIPGGGTLVSLAAGDTTREDTCTRCFVANDDTSGADSTATLSVNAGSNYELGATSSVTVTVLDDDTVMGISTQTTSVVEGRAAVMFTVTPDPSPSLVARTVGVDLSVTGDFEFVGNARRDVQIGVGTPSAVFTVEIAGDNIVDTQGELRAQVRDDGVWKTNSATRSASVTILDNHPVVTISPPTEPVSEGATAVFTLNLLPAPASTLSVNVEHSGSGGSLTVEVGTTTTQTFNVTTSNNAAVEDSMVTATVLAGTGYVVGADSTADATVLDNDAVISISAGESSVAEGDSAVFTVTADPPPPSPRAVSASLAVTGGFEIEGGVTSHEVELTTAAPTAMFMVTLGDDDEVEPSGTLTATLATGSSYQLGATSSVTVTVLDDDTVMEISAQATPVVEGRAVAVFTLTPDPSPSLVTRTVEVDLAVTGDFALVGNARRPVEIAEGDTSATFSVEIEGDDIVDAQGELRADIRNGAWKTNSATRSASVTILDNHPVVTILPPASPISEGASAVFTLNLFPAPTSTLSVNVEHSGVGGSLPVEVMATTTQTFNVTISNNAAIEDSMVTATVLTGTGYVVGAESTATAEVLDNDAVMSIRASQTSIAEGDSVEFTVTANPPPPSPRTVAVNVAVTGEFAIDGGVTSHMLELSAATPTVMFMVTIGDDDEGESSGTLTATLASGPGYQLGTAAATVTLNSDDGDPDVNASGSVDASDALILYYSYSLRNDLGTGR